MHKYASLIAAILFIVGDTVIAGELYALKRQFDSVIAVQQQGENNIVVGTVRHVETFERTVTISDYWGRAMVFTVKDSGSIFVSKDSMDQFATIYDLKPGVQVQITYTGLPEKPDAVRIVILPHTQYWGSIP